MRAALWLLVGNNVTRTAPRVLLTTGWNISRKERFLQAFSICLETRSRIFLVIVILKLLLLLLLLLILLQVKFKRLNLFRLVLNIYMYVAFLLKYNFEQKEKNWNLEGSFQKQQ